MPYEDEYESDEERVERLRHLHRAEVFEAEVEAVKAKMVSIEGDVEDQDAKIEFARAKLKVFTHGIESVFRRWGDEIQRQCDADPAVEAVLAPAARRLCDMIREFTEVYQ